MADELTLLQTTLKDRGFSVTHPRQAVFLALQNREPQTMREIVTRCHNKIDRASVYRTIALFEKLGVVQHLQIGWKYKLELSDVFSYHHHHLSCVNCGVIIPLSEDLLLENRLHLLAQKHNFQPETHQLEIRGLCQNCRL